MPSALSGANNMQIHFLELSAIGPFAGTHAIDFESLSAAGIFLLEGPTGAGKSTLIDAIVFGLYGQVAGGASSNDRIRSGLVDGNTESYVDLVFETASGIYRVRRTPQFMRAKKRGTGLTRTQAQVRLWQLSVADLERIKAAGSDGIQNLVVGEFKSERMDEAGLEITRAIGLDRAQFVQTIVLPQGEFANFLKAKPEERRDLLQKVFGTEIYQRVQDELAAMRREVKGQTDAANAELDRAKTGFVTAAGLEEEQAAEFEATHPEELLDAVGKVLADLDLVGRDTAERSATTQQAADKAKQELDKGQAQLKADQRRTALQGEQAKLVEQMPGIDRSRMELAAAAKAAIVTPAVEVADSARKVTDLAAAALERATEATVPILGLDQTGDEATLRKSAGAHLRSLGQQRGRLDQLLDLERSLPSREKANTKLESALTADRTELAKLEALLEKRPAGLRELQDIVAGLTTTAGRSQNDQHAVERAQERLDSCAAAIKTKKALTTAQTSLQLANTAATQAITYEAQLRTARVSEIAGELGQSLEQGCPCPVCGATEHPQPAKLGEDAVSVEQIEAAEVERKQAEETVGTWQNKVTQLAERLAAQEIAGLTIEAAQTALAEAKLAAAQSGQAQKDLAPATLAVTEFEYQTQMVKDQAADLHTGIATQEVTLDLNTKSVAGDRKKITDELETNTSFAQVTSIGQLAQGLENQEVLLENLLKALTDLESARSQVAEQSERLAKILQEQGFETAQQAQEVALTKSESERLTTLIRTYEADVTRVQTELASPELQDLPSQITVVLEGLEQLSLLAVEEARTAGAAATTATNRATAAAQAQRVLDTCLTKIAKVLAESAPVIRMADIAAGQSSDNAKRLTLQTFVLLKRFEDVIVMANERLVSISDGRYELERSDDRETGGGNRLGLALKIIDHDLDEPRDPKTLSGGETFYVSLCLALGLADVVTAETGGVELGTLFIDEGFGTLDPGVLESVLQVLATLRSGGRTVGVVSHVEALKQTILDGISVRHLPAGGSTLTLRA
ncbi:SMC family ATPase [Jonesiaceae bacterium BS-20]|uniref:Nuclease SbcCD subunit C n=1 Tax=Jonesiaceae bacterium BS-20 TaxID=3120821 RepID=A0AAU7DUH2_9MICO